MTTYADWVQAGRDDGRELVRVHAEGPRATVTLDDAGHLNALSPGVMLQLQDALTRLTDDPALRTIVLTGADPAFCAGGDLEMIAGGSRAIRDATDDADTSDAWRWIRHRFGAIVRTITRADQLVVAAVNGPAAGVGLAFALSCDVLLCSEPAPQTASGSGSA